MYLLLKERPFNSSVFFLEPHCSHKIKTKIIIPSIQNQNSLLVKWQTDSITPGGGGGGRGVLDQGGGGGGGGGRGIYCCKNKQKSSLALTKSNLSDNDQSSYCKQNGQIKNLILTMMCAWEKKN